MKLPDVFEGFDLAQPNLASNFFDKFSGGPGIVLMPDPEQVPLIQRLFVQNMIVADGLFTPDGRFHSMPTIDLFHHRRPPVFNNAEGSEAS